MGAALVMVPAVVMAAVTRDDRQPQHGTTVRLPHDKLVLVTGVQRGRDSHVALVLERDHLVVGQVEVVMVHARRVVMRCAQEVARLVHV